MIQVGLALAILLPPSASAQTEQSPKELFLAATAAFAAGNYSATERQFIACRRALGDNATVDFNLGMTHLRLEELGRARVCLERAQRLAPRDRQTRDQLQGLYARLEQPVPPPPSWLHALWEGMRGGLTYAETIALASLSTLAAALLVGLWLLTDRRRWGWAAVLACVIAVPLGSLAIAAIAERVGPQPAIVVADAAFIRGGPGEEFGEIMRVPEGTDVCVLERPHVQLGADLALRVARSEGGLWCEVRTSSGVRGYVRRSLIEPI